MGDDQDGGLPGTEALQAAAMQLLAAARMFIDVAEHVVQDPKVVAQVAVTMAGMAKAAVQSFTPSAQPSGDAGDDDDGVEHIDVS